MDLLYTLVFAITLPNFDQSQQYLAEM